MSETSNTAWDPSAAPAEAAPRGLVGDFFAFLWENKWWWMVPTFLILGLLGFVIFSAQDNSVAPFIYALF